MDTNSERAKRLLIHYFRMIADKAGVNWGGDNDAEVADIVDCILDSARKHADEEISPDPDWERDRS